VEENKKNELVERDRRVSSSEASGNSSEQAAEQSEQKIANAVRATGSSSEQKRTEPFPELDFSAFILSRRKTPSLYGWGYKAPT
jgi:hypothetical protein